MASRAAKRAGRGRIAVARLSQAGPNYAAGQRISSRHVGFSRRPEEELAARAGRDGGGGLRLRDRGGFLGDQDEQTAADRGLFASVGILNPRVARVRPIPRRK
jgi:hypothetical protein